MKGKGISEACEDEEDEEDKEDEEDEEDGEDEEVYVVAILARSDFGGVGIMLDIASEVRIRFAGFGERLGVRFILMVKVLVE